MAGLSAAGSEGGLRRRPQRQMNGAVNASGTTATNCLARSLDHLSGTNWW